MSKVDNGWILQISKHDYITNRPDVKISVHSTLNEVIDEIKKGV